MTGFNNGDRKHSVWNVFFVSKSSSIHWLGRKTTHDCELLRWAFFKFSFLFYKCLLVVRRSSSSVGIATDYGLDGPGSNPGGTRFSALSDRL